MSAGAPDIASLIAQHMGGGGMGPQQAGPPPGPQGPPPGQGGGAPLEIIKQMIQQGMQYIQVEKDPERKATMAKVVATLHAYEADEQKQQDAALGTSPAMKAMRTSARG